MPRQLPNDPRPWTLIARSYLHQRPPWLTLRQDHLRLPSGREIEEYWISEFPPWGNVVAITPDDEIVLVRQYRPGIEGVYYELPAGVVDNEDHDFEAGARRELLEETGYGGGKWSLLMTLSANPALTTNLTYTYLAEGVTRVKDAAPEETEDLTVHLLPVRELAGIIDDGDVVQALHAAPMLRYLLQRTSR
ncbi:MAG TPA: NUDIX hydrolase [Polyangia bacterium]